MLGSIRDVAAVLFLENRLGLLREEFLNQAIAGNPPDPDFWVSRENIIMEDLKRKFYNSKIQRIIEVDNNKDVDDEEDFNNRSQKFMELAIWSNHKKLQAIPYVGHNDFCEH